MADVEGYKAEIRRSFALVEPIATQAAAIFYPTLWEVNPNTKVRFRVPSPNVDLVYNPGVVCSIQRQPTSPSTGLWAHILEPTTATPHYSSVATHFWGAGRQTARRDGVHLKTRSELVLPLHLLLLFHMSTNSPRVSVRSLNPNPYRISSARVRVGPSVASKCVKL